MSIVFLDTETLGLDIDAPIWEIAAIRRDDSDRDTALHLFVRHYADPWLDGFPEQFAADYRSRYVKAEAVHPLEAAEAIAAFMHDRPHIVGAVPDFDTTRIRHQLLRPNRIADPWHYHLIDVENLVVGWLHGVAARAIDEARMRGEEPLPGLVDRPGPPYKSDELSRAVGVNPDDFERHTALGDALWVRAQYDAVMGGAS